MTEIRQITTIEQLYRQQGSPIGEIFVDAVTALLKERPTLNEAESFAILLDMKESVLSAILRRLTGSSLKDAIMVWRLWQALDLMDSHPEMDTQQIAEQCGFARAQQLGVKFRQRFGTTVAAYRNGSAIRNGKYDYNQDAEAYRAVMDNAQRLHKRYETD